MKKTVTTLRCDAQIDSDVCDRYNNAEITLLLKVCLRQINPADGNAEGTYHDYGDTTADERRIVRWSPSAWRAWKSDFARTAEKFWHGKFWLINNRPMTPGFTHCYVGAEQSVCHKSLDFEDGKVLYRPNIWCRFKLKTVEQPGDAHHTIDVVRLHSTEHWFGSHAKLYDSKDTHPVKKKTDSKGNPIMQRAHVHEIGHLLGLGHVDEGKSHCPTTGDTNATACYGVADEDKNDVMGGGMTRRSWQADPWRRAAVRLTGAGTAGSADDWKPVMKRHYPRTMDDVHANKQITSRPYRG